MPDPGTITRILQEASSGERAALDRIVPLLYDELGRLARLQLRRAANGGELDTRGLIHEAYLRMVDLTGVSWSDRAHFFAYAGRAMRSVLLDAARRQARRKRGGGVVAVTLGDGYGPATGADREAVEVLELEEALRWLERVEPRLCRVVECRFFAGLSDPETAEVLGVSPRTIRRDWVRAKLYLLDRLSAPAGDASAAGGPREGARGGSP
jgi:RNA polymerase sigma factor (TIGR02999 family)